MNKNIIYRKSSLKKGETKKIMKVIYTTFINLNKNTSDEETYKIIKKYYSKNSDTKITRDRLLKAEIHILALHGKKVIGTIRGKKNYLNSLYVLPMYTGKGIGKTLLEIFEEEAKNRGSEEIQLKTSTYAKEFYIKNGYKELSQKRLSKKL